MRKLLSFLLLFSLAVVSGGCGSSGPQSSTELVAAYRAAQASGDKTQIDRLIAWIDDVRPDLADPYDGGEPARCLTRQAIAWALVRPSDSGEQTTIEMIERPEEYQAAAIAPLPLYWVRIEHHSAGAGQANNRLRGCIELPVIAYNGAHRFYGSPHCTVETSFDVAGMPGHRPKRDACEIPCYAAESSLLVRREQAP